MKLLISTYSWKFEICRNYLIRITLMTGFHKCSSFKHNVFKNISSNLHPHTHTYTHTHTHTHSFPVRDRAINNLHTHTHNYAHYTVRRTVSWLVQFLARTPVICWNFSRWKSVRLKNHISAKIPLKWGIYIK